MALKYIVGHIGFAIFDEGQTHAHMAARMSSRPEGAGFCTIAVGYQRPDQDGLGGGEYVNVHCYGESITLGLKSRVEDEEIIQRGINTYH